MFSPKLILLGGIVSALLPSLAVAELPYPLEDYEYCIMTEDEMMYGSMKANSTLTLPESPGKLRH